MDNKVLTGLDRLIAGDFSTLRQKRLGVIVNQTSCDSRFTHLLSHIFNRGLDLRVIFSPEHGYIAGAQDMETVKSEPMVNGVPVVSLYGDKFESLYPPDEFMSRIEALVFDVQDIGSRYYTFAATLFLAMLKAKEHGVKVYVLDRPNPLNGVQIEGNGVKSGYESFVGLVSVATRHGLTVGELAQFANQKLKIDCELEVVSCEGLTRQMWFDETGLPWVIPSPNMPRFETALVYPGMCLVEGTNLSEGRGTTLPFELFGAPFLDGEKLAALLNDYNLEGVAFRPAYFKPMFHKFAGEVCGGVQIYITDRGQFKPFLTGIACLSAAHELAAERFKWRTEPYEFVSKIPAIDLLFGDDYLRLAIDRLFSISEIVSYYFPMEQKFLKEREDFLIYA